MDKKIIWKVLLKFITHHPTYLFLFFTFPINILNYFLRLELITEDVEKNPGVRRKR